MLVLSRKVNERIFIDVEGFRVELVVVAIEGRTVRLGISAPACVNVNREEVARRKEGQEGAGDRAG